MSWRRNSRGLLRSARGVTLIELMVAIGLLSLLFLGVGAMMRTAGSTIGMVTNYSNFLSDARTSLIPMTRDLRQAGLDRSGAGSFGFQDSVAMAAVAGPPAFPAVTAFTARAEADRILVSSDVDENGRIDDNNQERIGFMLINGNLVRTMNGTASSGLRPLATDVTSLQFQYFNASGLALTPLPLSAANRQAIRQIRMTVTFSKTSNQVTRTHTVTTDVRPRNL